MTPEQCETVVAALIQLRLYWPDKDEEVGLARVAFEKMFSGHAAIREQLDELKTASQELLDAMPGHGRSEWRGVESQCECDQCCAAAQLNRALDKLETGLSIPPLNKE